MKKISLSLLIAFIICSFSLKASDGEVQLIAVHIGNLDNMSVLDKTAFPDFEFYSNDASLIKYSETQKMIGNPKYLMGWYGEIPEKMGFSANYRGELGKGYSSPSAIGALYVIDPENTIGYQTKPNNRSNIDTREIISLVKKYKKGKYSSKLKVSKQQYIKESAIGELEQTKGASIDKDGEGIVGWEVPDITIKNENGEAKSLKEIVNGKTTILVFFTLNGVHWKKGDAKGEIEKEWDGHKLLAPKDSPFEKQAMEGDYETKSEAKKGFAKAMFKQAVGSSDADLAKLVILDKEELSQTERIEAYTNAVEFITLIQDIAKDLKK